MTTDVEFYNPGDLIHSETPFVHALYITFQGKNCDRCLTGCTNLKRCVACNYVWYCGKKCQREDWSDHKNECKYLNRFPAEVAAFSSVNSCFRLIARLVLKLKGKDWKTYKESIGNTTISFEDLLSHHEDRMNDSKAALFNMEVMHQLKSIIGEENLPHQNHLFEIIGKVKHNAFQAAFENSKVEASCLYLGASLFNHACITNAANVFNKGKIEIRAINKIPKGDLSKVTIAYQSMISPEEDLQDMFKSFYSPCFCIDCSLPYGESILSKVIDKKTAYSVIDTTKRFLQSVGNMPLDQMNNINKDSPASQLLMSQVDHILNMQNGVLGETNILRIRVLYLKCKMWNHISDIEKLINSLTLAFGENSYELMYAYALLRTVHCRDANIPKVFKCQEKIDRLLSIHYGPD